MVPVYSAWIRVSALELGQTCIQWFVFSVVLCLSTGSFLICCLFCNNGKRQKIMANI